MNRRYDSILEAIGHTPIIPLRRLLAPTDAQVFGKYEAANPTFSLKDRIAKALIEKAEERGDLKPGMEIIHATGGNTGIALALVCAVKKWPLTLFMPEDASLERRRMLKGFGAKFHLTPKQEGMPGAIQRAAEYLKQHPETYSINQFEDEENPRTHARTTAQEILDDFPHGVDALVQGVGTGGSLTGVGEVLKAKFPHIQVIAVEPEGSPILSQGRVGPHRISQLGYGFIPKILKRELLDRVIAVSDSEAYEMTQQMAKKEGLLLGISSGANVVASLKVAKELGVGKKVLTFFCDAGQRYFSLANQ